MRINLLRARDLRCFEAVEFAPGPAINWLVGENGAGKTTLLEAVYILSHGRSFRAGSRSGLCRQGTSSYLIYAENALDHGSHHRLGLARKDERWEARLDGSDLTTLAPLFKSCPVVCFGLGDVPRGTSVPGGVAPVASRIAPAQCPPPHSRRRCRVRTVGARSRQARCGDPPHAQCVPRQP